MPLDSESRWRLVRRAKNAAPQVEGELTIRVATTDDLVQVAEVYNY